jgi:hypothetical protein
VGIRAAIAPSNLDSAIKQFLRSVPQDRARPLRCRFGRTSLEQALPSNRLVAATLEKRWNDAMQRVLELEVKFANFQRHVMRVLAPEQKQQILQVGKDFPRLWKASTTSTCDRKRMLRLLIRDITIAKHTDPKLLHLQVRWQGGATDTIEVHRRPNRADAMRYSDMSVAEIQAMAEKYDDQEIAAQLNSQALTSSTGKAFTANMVRWIRFKASHPRSVAFPWHAYSQPDLRKIWRQPMGRCREGRSGIQNRDKAPVCGGAAMTSPFRVIAGANCLRLGGTLIQTRHGPNW